MKNVILLGFCWLIIASCSEHSEHPQYEDFNTFTQNSAFLEGHLLDQEIQWSSPEILPTQANTTGTFDCPSDDGTTYYVCTNYVFEVPDCNESSSSPLLSLKIETSPIVTELAIFRKTFLQVFTEFGGLVKEVQIEDEILASIGRNITINASQIDVPSDGVYVFIIRAVYRSGAGVGNIATFHNGTLQCRQRVSPLVPIGFCDIQDYIFCGAYYTCPSPNIYVKTVLPSYNKVVYTDDYLFAIGNIEWKIFNDNLTQSPLIINNQNNIHLPCGKSIVELTFSREGCTSETQTLEVLNSCTDGEVINPGGN